MALPPEHLEAWRAGGSIPGSSNPVIARLVNQSHVQRTQRTVRFVDLLVDFAIRIKPPHVQPLPAPMKVMQHPPDSVTERIRLASS